MNYLPWLSLFVGLAARVFVPWLAKRRYDPDNAKWQWRYLWPQVLGFVLLLVVLPLIVSDLRAIYDMPAQAAWVLGWGAADIGRKTIKALSSETDD